MRHLLLTLILALAGCGYVHKRDEATPKADDRVAELRAAVASRPLAFDAETGWPSAKDCDATLWAGLAKATGVSAVKLDLAEVSPGSVARRPAAYGPCYPSESKSSVSRDMILGYTYGMWASADLPALERLADYGSAHSWEMGEGDRTRTTMTPDGIGVLERAIEALSGGHDKRDGTAIPYACFPVSADYEQHLQVVGALLAAEVADVLEGEEPAPKLLDMPGSCFEGIKSLAEKNPKDALFQAAYGIYTGDLAPAITLLLDPQYQSPSYVRGADAYRDVHWLFAAHTVLKRFKE